ncbi:MAG TPA: cytochrome b N-terminal domain-containing protein [Gemmatimonadaceae bacterium]|nr:cytochrome b N-terminal domain-containing protein [Gemmatimonadaceae bacterium]
MPRESSEPGSVRERLALHGLEYPIAPTANRLLYMLGGLTFFGILLLVLTGVILDQYYDPTPLAAHDSIVFIMTRVPLGEWLRGLHYWGACIVLVTVFLHMSYVFWRRSYVRPREVTWWAGVILFLVLFAMAFTGTVLRADQEGGEAMAHAIAGAGLAGPLGFPMSPDFTSSTSLLSRMHSAHVSLLPLVLLALVALHFWLIRLHGINASEPKTSRFSSHLPKLTGYALLLLALAGTLAAFFPPGIGYPSVGGVEVTKPFWPFLWIYVVENTMGMVGMVVAPIIIFGFLFIIPLLDRPRPGRERPRWLVMVTIFVLALYVGGIVYGFFAPHKQHLGM